MSEAPNMDLRGLCTPDTDFVLPLHFSASALSDEMYILLGCAVGLITLALVMWRRHGWTHLCTLALPSAVFALSVAGIAHTLEQYAPPCPVLIVPRTYILPHDQIVLMQNIAHQFYLLQGVGYGVLLFTLIFIGVGIVQMIRGRPRQKEAPAQAA